MPKQDRIPKLVEVLRQKAQSYEKFFGEGESSVAMRQAADAIEELLAAMPHWISVEERLPEIGIDVLVTDGSDVCISHQVRYVSPTERFTFWSRDDLDLTHWMPLPEPPKEETP